MVLRSVVRAAGLGLVAFALSGCAWFNFFGEQREPWREVASERCLATGLVRPSSFVKPRRSIDGPGICGLEKPFTVTAGAGGRVAFSKPAILDCPMIVATDRWIDRAVQPTAMALFGQPVVALQIAGSYSCRGRNGASKGPLSEHSFGNAIDVSGFTFADGSQIIVASGWRSESGAVQTFLRAVHRGGCRQFLTVIGPDGDRKHQDHIHLDLARYGNVGKAYPYCK